MEKEKKQKKLNKLHLDLPRIENKPSTTRISQKQNAQSCLNFQLSPKMKDLRKLFFQYRSNARILQKSPYYNKSDKSRKKLVQAISTRRYDLTEEIEKQINERYEWHEKQDNQTTQLKIKKQIEIKLHYQNRVHLFVIQCRTCEQLKQKVTLNFAKIIYSLKNTYKKCQQIVSYETMEENNQINFMLSNPHLQITFLDKLNIKPIFSKIGFNSSASSNKISIKDFKFIKCLGNGGFSTVFLVKGNFDGKYYALKLIDKKFIIESDRDAIVQNQRFILGQLLSPFTTALQFSFQTKNSFVLVIQCKILSLYLLDCPGGQLFYQLKRVKRMKQNQAKFYFLQILMGLDYIHSKKFIYRDLKPQNLLIGMDGHIKIADFGLSKPIDCKQQKSYSFCGSPQYMAPQMLMKQFYQQFFRSGHNYLLDYYCLGALLYELVFGVPPYYSLKHEEIYQSILSQELSFPYYVQVSQELKALLRGLLEKNSKKRLGSMFGVKQILLHPWVGKIKQKSIQNKQLVPPFIPNLQNFNFDLTDIRTDQQAINKKIQEDMMITQFQTHFNEQFYYQNQQSKKCRQTRCQSVQTGKKQKKLISKSNSIQHYVLMSNRNQTKLDPSTTFKQDKSSSKQAPHNFTSRLSRKLRKVNSSNGFTLIMGK